MENEVKYCRKNQTNKKELLFRIRSENNNKEKQFWIYLGCSIISGILALISVLSLPTKNDMIYIDSLKSIIILILVFTFMVIQLSSCILGLKKMGNHKTIFKGNYFDLDQNNLKFKMEFGKEYKLSSYKLTYEIYSYSSIMFTGGLLISLLGIFMSSYYSPDYSITTYYNLDILGCLIFLSGLLIIMAFTFKNIDKGDFEGELPSIDKLEKLEGFYYLNRPSTIIKPKQPEYPK